MGNRHKVFVSYHHANDQRDREVFETLMTGHHDGMVSRSVQIGDLDPNLKTETIRRRIREEYLRDSTVTVVLIGRQTWQRKHVDWEIASSVRETAYNSRSGLVGVLLPSYSQNGQYNRYTIPPRLWDNVQAGYAEIVNWTNNASAFQEAIHLAFKRRDSDTPVSSRPLFVNNRSGAKWQD